MKCEKCGAELTEGQRFCSACGAPVAAANGAAADGGPVPPQAGTVPPQPGYVPPQPGYAPPQPQQPFQPVPVATKSRTAAGILGILLGGLGIHKFYLGYSTAGLVMLLISLVAGVFSFGIASCVIWIIGIIEGVIYLTKTDQQFYNEYVLNTKEWF